MSPRRTRPARNAATTDRSKDLMRQDFKSFFSRAKLLARPYGQTGRRAGHADCQFHGGACAERAGPARWADWVWAAVEEPWAVGLAALSLRGAWGKAGGLWAVEGRGWIGRGGRIGRIGGGGGGARNCRRMPRMTSPMDLNVSGLSMAPARRLLLFGEDHAVESFKILLAEFCQRTQRPNEIESPRCQVVNLVPRQTEFTGLCPD